MADFLPLALDHTNPIVPFADDHVWNEQTNGLLLRWKDRFQEKILKKTDLPLLAHAWEAVPTQGILNALYVQAYGTRDMIATVDRSNILSAVAFVDALIPPGSDPAPANRLTLRDQQTIEEYRQELVRFLFIDNGNFIPPFSDIYTAAPVNAVDGRSGEVQALDPFINGNVFANDFDPIAFCETFNSLLESHHRDDYGSFLISQVIQGLFCFIQRGGATPAKILKLESALTFNEGIVLDLSPDSVNENYHYLNQYIVACHPDVDIIFSTIATVFTAEVSLRMKLMISQARGAGSAPITMTLDAIQKFPDHPVWGFLEQKCRGEMTAFINAARYLARHPFIQYDAAQLQQHTRGTNFPSLVVASLTIANTMGMGKTLSRYKGKFVSIYKTQIDYICTAFKAKMDEQVDVTVYDQGGANHLDWVQTFPDLHAAINATNDIS